MSGDLADRANLLKAPRSRSSMTSCSNGDGEVQELTATDRARGVVDGSHGSTHREFCANALLRLCSREGCRKDQRPKKEQNERTGLTHGASTSAPFFRSRLAGAVNGAAAVEAVRCEHEAL